MPDLHIHWRKKCVQEARQFVDNKVSQLHPVGTTSQIIAFYLWQIILPYRFGTVKLRTKYKFIYIVHYKMNSLSDELFKVDIKIFSILCQLHETNLHVVASGLQEIWGREKTTTVCLVNISLAPFYKLLAVSKVLFVLKLSVDWMSWLEFIEYLSACTCKTDHHGHKMYNRDIFNVC